MSIAGLLDISSQKSDGPNNKSCFCNPIAEVLNSMIPIQPNNREEVFNFSRCGQSTEYWFI